MKIKRKKPKPRQGPTLFGVPWYRPWQWQRFRELAADREEIEDTYGEWLEMMARRMPELNQSGIVPVKVDIDVEEVAAWCKQQGRPMDSSARARFVTEKLQKGEYLKE